MSVCVYRTGAGKVITGLLALLRKVILLVPLAIILPEYFGVSGIYYAEPIADIIAVFVTSVLFFDDHKKVFA